MTQDDHISKSSGNSGNMISSQKHMRKISQGALIQNSQSNIHNGDPFSKQIVQNFIDRRTAVLSLKKR